MTFGTPFWRSDSRLCHGGVVLLCLLGYMAAVVGYPLPAVVQKSGAPFPCQHHACGCVNAEQCWRDCCCFTPQEKLAWARENHVTPPTYAELALDASQLAEHDGHEHGDQGHSSCHVLSVDVSKKSPRQAAAPHGASRSCCASHSAAADVPPKVAKSRGCGGCKKALGGDESCKVDSPDDEKTVRFVSGDAWRRCRGLPTMWITTGAALPLPASVRWQFSWDVVEWLSTSTPALYDGCLAPPIPPPRV
jgi:hypothetical protein